MDVWAVVEGTVLQGKRWGNWIDRKALRAHIDLVGRMAPFCLEIKSILQEQGTNNKKDTS